MTNYQEISEKFPSIDSIVKYHKTQIRNFINNPKNPNIYSDDQCPIDSGKIVLADIKGWKGYLQSAYFKNHLCGNSMGACDKHIHNYLPVAPFAGDIVNANIVILLLNPGVSPDNYFQIEKILPSRKEQYNNILRTRPLFMSREWTGGFRYGLKIIKPLIQELVGTEFFSADEAFELIRRNVAILELSPYPSISFNDHVLELYSSMLARRTLELMLNAGKIVICLRGYDKWTLDLGDENKLQIFRAESRTPTLRNIDNLTIEKLAKLVWR